MAADARFLTLHIVIASNALNLHCCMAECELDTFTAAYSLSVGSINGVEKAVSLPYCMIDERPFFYVRNLIKYLECRSVCSIVIVHVHMRPKLTHTMNSMLTSKFCLDVA